MSCEMLLLLFRRKSRSRLEGKIEKKRTLQRDKEGLEDLEEYLIENRGSQRR